MFELLLIPFELMLGYMRFLAFTPPGWLMTAFLAGVLIDCVVREPTQGNEKMIWVTIILALQPVFGALIYLFVRRPQRKKAHGR